MPDWSNYNADDKPRPITNFKFCNLGFLAETAKYGQQQGIDLSAKDNIWDGLIHRFAITLLTSSIKSGKSTLLAQLLAAMHRGEPLLNRPIRKCRVVVVTDEDSAIWTNRMMTNPIAPETQLCIQPFVWTTPTFHELDDLFTAIESSKPDLVVLDPLASLLPAGVESNVSLAMKFIRLVQEKFCRTGALLLLHHTKQSSLEARGTGVFGASAGITIDLRPYSNKPDDLDRRILYCKSRFGRGPSAIAYELDSIAHRLREIDLPEIRRHKSLWSIIRDVLESAGVPLTAMEIRTQWPEMDPVVSRTQLYAALQLARENRLLEATGRGIHVDPLRYQLAKPVVIDHDSNPASGGCESNTVRHETCISPGQAVSHQRCDSLSPR